MGTLDWFELAGHRFDDPGVMFATARTGALATLCVAGTMGMQFMQPFLVVFDFSA